MLRLRSLSSLRWYVAWCVRFVAHAYVCTIYHCCFTCMHFSHVVLPSGCADPLVARPSAAALSLIFCYGGSYHCPLPACAGCPRWPMPMSTRHFWRTAPRSRLASTFRHFSPCCVCRASRLFLPGMTRPSCASTPDYSARKWMFSTYIHTYMNMYMCRQ